MNSNKNIKSIIRKYLLEQTVTYGPPDWFRVPPNTPQDTTNYEYSPDGKWYKQKNTPAPNPEPNPAPNTSDGALVAVTAAVFKGIESVLGKGLGTIRDGVMYVPNKIMDQYNESLKEPRYRYRDENGGVLEYPYDDMGKKISIGDVKLTTQVKKLLYNPTTKQREPGPTKKASEYPELKEFFWGDDGQNEVGNQTQVETESETTKQIETLRPYMSKGFFGKEGVDFEEIQITTLPGYYIGIKLLKPREGKTVVLLYDNKISIMSPDGTLSVPKSTQALTAGSTATAGTTATATSGVIKRQGDPYEYKVESDNWLAKKTGTQKWFSITGADFKPAYQKSIDTLDTENPKSRTANAPKRTK
jgi:hypothetical protein